MVSTIDPSLYGIDSRAEDQAQEKEQGVGYRDADEEQHRPPTLAGGVEAPARQRGDHPAERESVQPED